MPEQTNSAIEQAMRSVAAAVAEAAADPQRPVYHFHPPAQWMNDPNGTIFHNGYYHLFYQHNPYGDEWGHMHWGHARSTDLVHWEHLPIALWPSLEAGEEHCFSGCAAVDGDGRPLLLYTKVAPRTEDDPLTAEQWAAQGSADWITWEKHPANPILSLENHGGPPFEPSWRDPYIFQEAGRSFLVLGGTFGETAGIALYEATDASLTQWTYCKLLYALPQSELPFLECPNFFKVDETWVLLHSPYTNVHYLTGDFELYSLTFTPQQSGVLDHGQSDVPHFYATNTLYDHDDEGHERAILLGWVRGFRSGHGWNGCLALPRLLTVDEDGQPRQKPIPELRQLRGQHAQYQNIELQDTPVTLEKIVGDTLELQAQLQLGKSQAVGLRVRRSVDGTRSVAIRWDGSTLTVGENSVPLSLPPSEALTLHIFLDKSVLEVFADHGRVCITQVHYSPVEDLFVEAFAEGGIAHLAQCDAWELNPGQ